MFSYSLNILLRLTLQLQLTRDKLNNLKGAESSLKGRAAEAQKRYDSLEADYNKQYGYARFMIIWSYLTSYCSEIMEIEQQLPSLKEKIDQDEAYIKTMRSKEADYVTHINKLQAELSVRRQQEGDTRSNNTMLAALMRERQNGNIPGILGRLGDLGAIDQRYDVAISTCCGGLDNILVEDVDTAQACIRLLKDQKLGRTTFIVLEKQNHFWKQLRNKPQM